MITCLGKILSAEEVELVRGTLASAEFADGRVTAGVFGSPLDVVA